MKQLDISAFIEEAREDKNPAEKAAGQIAAKIREVVTEEDFDDKINDILTELDTWSKDCDAEGTLEDLQSWCDDHGFELKQ